jgi:adenylylsulfate kinase
MVMTMPQREKGFVLWFTGIAGTGKSTLATAVEQRLRDLGLDVENLDADVVRANLSPNLGFTAEARDENTKRLAWMGQMLSKYGVNVLIAAVAPLQYYRDRARSWCEKFVEVYVDAPLEVCRARDPKGVYAKADAGKINDLAGVHMPYEEPPNPEVHVRTDRMSVGECAEAVLCKLEELGYLKPGGGQACEPEGAYTNEEQAKVEDRLRGLGYV